MSSPEANSSPVQRSPRFPSFGLDWAVEGIKKLHEQDGKAPVDRDAAARHLGYKGLNGASSRAIASLIYYDLVEGASQGRIRLTERALRVLYSGDPNEKLPLLQEALTSPKIFDELVSHYGGIASLPSDVTLLKELVIRRKFSDGAARECILALRQSVLYLKSLSEASEKPTPPINSPEFVKPEVMEAESSKALKIGDEVRDPTIASEVIPARLSSRTRAELHIMGPLDLRSAKKLKSWMDNVVKPWVDHMLDELEDEELNEAEKA